MLIWTGFSGERCGPWASCFSTFLFPFFWSQTFSNYLLKSLIIIPSMNEDQGIYIEITVCPSVCLSVYPSVCPSAQICVWLITFLWHRAKLEMPSASSHRKALKLLSNHRCQTVNASTETHASCNGVWILYLRPLLYNFNLNWEVNKKWMINIK